MQPVWAVVVAAGSGQRYGTAKQYAVLDGRTTLARSVAVARTACDGVVVVVPAGDEDLAVVRESGADVVVTGGASRSASVRAGLAAVPGDVEIVVVHDAARPLADPSLFASVVHAVREGADGAICAIAVTDTIKRVEGEFVAGTLDRTGLVSVQTPQAFRATVLRRAHRGEPEATDDAALVEAAGGKVVVVPGDPRNLKLTEPADLATAEALLR
ncbi:MAG TPA: 2-C-methyl-D-erythritol 4-phosphate cytidylyltransferase [Acidimicrobiales bacterium]|nr:2-C-methyl-D-erythritol 4-phosphate cytidylyltransferase [Acidimicrobiales bacterium]